MTNELTQLSNKQRCSLPDDRLQKWQCSRLSRAKLPVTSEILGARAPELVLEMGLFLFASSAFFPGTPTHARNYIRGERERSAWQSCQRVKALKRAEKLSGFHGPWHGPGKVTQKDPVSWDIYLHLRFKSLEECTSDRRVNSRAAGCVTDRCSGWCLLWCK